MTSPSESHGVQTTPTDASGQADQPTSESHGHEPAHEHAAPPTGPLFSDAEWKELQSDDVHAGGAVVALMASIFFVGLMLYATIALIVNT